MIPCFPVLMRIIVTLYQIVPRHLILQRIVLLIFPKLEPGQLQNIYATAWKIIKDIIWEIVIRGNAHMLIMLQFISGRTINQYLKLVLFTVRVNNSRNILFYTTVTANILFIYYSSYHSYLSFYNFGCYLT